jgi:hypothetical protein
MRNAKTKGSALWGLLKWDLEREANEIPLGSIRYFERGTGGSEVIIIMANREDGLKVMAMGRDGAVWTLFDEATDGE